MTIDGASCWAKRIKIDAVETARMPNPSTMKGENGGLEEVDMDDRSSRLTNLERLAKISLVMCTNEIEILGYFLESSRN